MNGDKKKIKQRRNDARRIEVQSNKAKLWRELHPTYDRDRRRWERENYGREGGVVLDEVFQPLTFNSSDAIIAPDWHIPCHDAELIYFMITVAQDEGIDTIAIPGDMWDCSNYTPFIDLSWSNRFKKEMEMVGMNLQILTDYFKNVYICRGNHEDRWIKQNLGRMHMQELFATTGITEGYEVTNDDHMVMNPGNDPWLLCHPRNFRKNPGSVVKELATKYHMNVCGAHGHQWSNGLDASGQYRCIDGMGVFDIDSLEYMRRTTCHGAVVAGFWRITDGYPIEYRWSGKHGWAEKIVGKGKGVNGLGDL